MEVDAPGGSDSSLDAFVNFLNRYTHIHQNENGERLRASLEALHEDLCAHELNGERAWRLLLDTQRRIRWEALDFASFRCLYRFAFFAARPAGRKHVATEQVLRGWRLLLAGRFGLLDAWCAFVEARGRPSVSEDVWWQVLDFARGVRDDLTNYDVNGAWPVVVDEFVAHMQSLSEASAEGSPSWAGEGARRRALRHALPPKSGTKRKLVLHDGEAEQLASRLSTLHPWPPQCAAKRVCGAAPGEGGGEPPTAPAAVCWPPGGHDDAMAWAPAGSEAPSSAEGGWEGFISIHDGGGGGGAPRWARGGDGLSGPGGAPEMRRCETEPDASLHGGRTWGEVTLPSSRSVSHGVFNCNSLDGSLLPSASSIGTSGSAPFAMPPARPPASGHSAAAGVDDSVARSACGGAGWSQPGNLAPPPCVARFLSRATADGVGDLLTPSPLKRQSMHGTQEPAVADEGARDRLTNTWQELEMMSLRGADRGVQASSAGALAPPPPAARQHSAAMRAGKHAERASAANWGVKGGGDAGEGAADAATRDGGCLWLPKINASLVSRFRAAHGLSSTRSPASSDGTVSPGMAHVMRSTIEDGLGL